MYPKREEQLTTESPNGKDEIPPAYGARDPNEPFGERRQLTAEELHSAGEILARMGL